VTRDGTKNVLQKRYPRTDICVHQNCVLRKRKVDTIKINEGERQKALGLIKDFGIDERVLAISGSGIEGPQQNRSRNCGREGEAKKRVHVVVRLIGPRLNLCCFS